MSVKQDVPIRKKTPISKDDISEPLQDSVRHVGHIGPEYLPDHQRRFAATGGSETLLPTPCRGNAKEDSDSLQTLRSAGPVGGVHVNEAKLYALQEENRNMCTLAVELLRKVENVSHSKVSELEREVENLQKLAEKLKEKAEGITKHAASLHIFGDQQSLRPRNDAEDRKQKRKGIVSKDDDDFFPSEAGTFSSWNISEKLAANKTGSHGNSVDVDKSEDAWEDLYENTVEGVAARDGVHIARGILQTHVACGNKGEENTAENKSGADDSSCQQNEADRGNSGEANVIKNSITNPTYTYEISEENVTKDPQSVTDTKEQITGSQCTSSKGDTEVKTTWPSHCAYPQVRPNDRECLSEALRENMVDIVENVVFRESELPDELTADGCITEDECDIIRHFSNRRDQVRVLVSAIRGRDYEVLTMFHSRVKAANPEVAKKIQASFETNRRSKVQSRSCPRCKLIQRVNVRYVCDSLLAIHAIDDSLYNEIIHDSKPTGAQRELWNRVIDSINSLQTLKKRKRAIENIHAVLKTKNYKYIYSDIKSHSSSLPACQPMQIGFRGSDPVDYFSPRSSSEASRDSGELLDAGGREGAYDEEPRVKSPERQRRLRESSDDDLLETISEVAEPGKETQVQKPKPKPRKASRPESEA